ncbi:MAG: type II toxin-antitoxin system RelE/ParE family toxin [Coriobacteriia bacterium]|nr:type II toxin-antitoxin system RelE/ParE family toxin [Coriobacteriia bacterium]
MKLYEVLVSKEAEDDMEDIYDYIAVVLQVPETAAQQHGRIVDAILDLEFMPERIKLMDGEPERKLGLRQLSIDNYAAIFRVDGERVYIIRVLYGASNITAKLRT